MCNTIYVQYGSAHCDIKLLIINNNCPPIYKKKLVPKKVNGMPLNFKMFDQSKLNKYINSERYCSIFMYIKYNAFEMTSYCKRKEKTKQTKTHTHTHNKFKSIHLKSRSLTLEIFSLKLFLSLYS
jgi:hypothetical protein